MENKSSCWLSYKIQVNRTVEKQTLLRCVNLKKKRGGLEILLHVARENGRIDGTWVGRPWREGRRVKGTPSLILGVGQMRGPGQGWGSAISKEEIEPIARHAYDKQVVFSIILHNLWVKIRGGKKAPSLKHLIKKHDRDFGKLNHMEKYSKNSTLLKIFYKWLLF